MWGSAPAARREQLAHLMSLIGLQKEALAAGKTNLVSDDNLYNSAKEFTKLVGLKNVDRYFTDPKTQPAAATGRLIRLMHQAADEGARSRSRSRRPTSRRSRRRSSRRWPWRSRGSISRSS